jgi:hypothetical protein
LEKASWSNPRGFFILEVLDMTKEQKDAYRDCDELRDILKRLAGLKFKLDCGHHVTFGYFLGNDITIYNGKESKIICSQCGY